MSKAFGPDKLFVKQTAALYNETQELIAVQRKAKNECETVKALVRQLEQIEDQVRNPSIPLKWPQHVQQIKLVKVGPRSKRSFDSDTEPNSESSSRVRTTFS